MSSQQVPPFSVDRYVVIHVATTCDEHGVYVTKDSAEVIELGWILLDANTLEEVRSSHAPSPRMLGARGRGRIRTAMANLNVPDRSRTRAFLSSPSTRPSLRCAVSRAAPEVVDLALFPLQAQA